MALEWKKHSRIAKMESRIILGRRIREFAAPAAAEGRIHGTSSSSEGLHKRGTAIPSARRVAQQVLCEDPEIDGSESNANLRVKR